MFSVPPRKPEHAASDKFPRRLAATILVGLVAASCGETPIDLPDSAAANDFSDRVGENQFIYEELSERERDCIFEREADEIDLSLLVTWFGAAADAERTKAVQIGLDCVDEPAEWDGWVQFQADQLEVGLGQGIEMSTSEGSCVIAYALENAQNPARLFAVGDDMGDIERLVESLEECLSERNLSLFYGTEVVFDDYGDDPSLDALYEACDDGEMVSCDLLYALSGVDTGYEAFAESCGGGSPVSDLCTGIELSSKGSPVFGDARYGQLRDDCGAGDGVSCDLLFNISDFGSDLEDFGFSCGERLPLGGNPDCRTSMADS